MSDTPYIPFTHLPTEITEAAETLHVFFEKQGMREWQYSHVADRRLVNKLERELNAAKANPVVDVVRRMEAVPVAHLRNLHTNSRTISDGVEAVRARLIQAAKGEQP